MSAFHSLLAVRDEGDIILQSLEHQLQWADHIHVFDTGSTDGTWEILEEMAVRHPQIHLIGRRPVYFNDTEVRSFVFEQARSRMMAGDWVLRCDADEFHHILPPVFVQTQMRWHETSAYHQYYDFHFTTEDLKAWNEGRETLADRSRPIAERRRTYSVSQEHEPRLFRYRRRMHWPHHASFPVNAGFVAKNRLPIRHYPHRDPIQMEQRCKLRAQMLAYPPSRKTWKQANDHHWNHEDWKDLMLTSNSFHIDVWNGNSHLQKSHSSHLPSKPKRLVQYIFHLAFVWIFDALRVRKATGCPTMINHQSGNLSINPDQPR